MMRILILASFLLILATACSSSLSSREVADSIHNPAVHIMVNSEETIPRKATYSWGPRQFKINYNKKLDLVAVNKRIKNALSKYLAEKDYQYVESAEDADLLVGFAVALDTSISEKDLNRVYGEEFKFSFPLANEGSARSYRHGALIIDFLDNDSKSLLWRGALVAEVDMEVSEQERNKRAANAVGWLLDSFPKPTS